MAAGRPERSAAATAKPVIRKPDPYHLLGDSFTLRQLRFLHGAVAGEPIGPQGLDAFRRRMQTASPLKLQARAPRFSARVWGASLDSPATSAHPTPRTCTEELQNRNPVRPQ